jgi:hypothetical protein
LDAEMRTLESSLLVIPELVVVAAAAVVVVVVVVVAVVAVVVVVVAAAVAYHARMLANYPTERIQYLKMMPHWWYSFGSVHVAIDAYYCRHFVIAGLSLH